MLAEFKNHKVAYVILITVLFLFVLVFMQLWPDRQKQRWVISALSLFYFVWGIVVHTKHEHISTKVILEYFAVSILAGSILLFLTF